jgi:hypothetical protein
MNDKEPQVGIFWTYDDRLFHVESSPVSRGVKTLVGVDYAVGHYAAWFVMEKRGILDDLPNALQDEYDSIPRGRVVYLVQKEVFVIYHGDDFNDGIFKELIDTLNLPPERTYDEVDEHYNPLPEDFVF